MQKQLGALLSRTAGSGTVGFSPSAAIAAHHASGSPSRTESLLQTKNRAEIDQSLVRNGQMEQKNGSTMEQKPPAFGVRLVKSGESSGSMLSGPGISRQKCTEKQWETQWEMKDNMEGNEDIMEE